DRGYAHPSVCAHKKTLARSLLCHRDVNATSPSISSKPSRRLLTAVAATAFFSIPAVAEATPITVTFPFDGAVLLRPGEHEGGIAVVAEGIDRKAAPILVFLHGKNNLGPLHAEHAFIRSRVDLLVAQKRIAPVIVASPSQTQDATHHTF